MQKIYKLLSIIMLLVCMSSCSTTEEFVKDETDSEEVNPIVPVIKNLLISECLGHPDIDFIEKYGTNDNDYFEMKIDGSVAKCKFAKMAAECSWRLKVNASIKDNTLTIIAYCPNKHLADCECELESTFTIENIPEEDFRLKIYIGKRVTGEYDESRLFYDGKVVVADGALKVVGYIPDEYNPDAK